MCWYIITKEIINEIIPATLVITVVKGKKLKRPYKSITKIPISDTARVHEKKKGKLPKKGMVVTIFISPSPFPDNKLFSFPKP